MTPFKTDYATRSKIITIVNRTIDILKVQFDPKTDAADEMETALHLCHSCGCALDLDKLLTVDAGTLLHDVCGIRANIDPMTGQLQNCFLPRCTMSQRVQTMDEHEEVDRLNARNREQALS